jgi:hypothetical protein
LQGFGGKAAVGFGYANLLRRCVEIEHGVADVLLGARRRKGTQDDEKR